MRLAEECCAELDGLEARARPKMWGRFRCVSLWISHLLVSVKAAFGPNPKQCRKYLRSYDLQCDERAAASATTCGYAKTTKPLRRRRLIPVDGDRIAPC